MSEINWEVERIEEAAKAIVNHVELCDGQSELVAEILDMITSRCYHLGRNDGATVARQNFFERVYLPLGKN